MIHPSAVRWEQMYGLSPLSEAPYHFANIRRSPFLLHYLQRVLKCCPEGGTTLETGVGTGFGAVWLSLRGVQAEGIDYAPGIVERARQVNNILGGSATFRVGDLFTVYSEGAPRYSVIHHQGVLEHFGVPWIHAALAQQVACADWVVFSVPSVYYPYDPEFGDERLLPIEEWERILAPFDVAELCYYGDPRCGERDHVLGVLRGQAVNEALLARMIVEEEPYPEGVSAIVHTRNEARHIEPCLQSLQGLADEIIVCDMESEDATVEIARRYTDNIFPHPLISNFDRARNASAMRAKYRHILYLDADERVPPGLGEQIKEILKSQGGAFEAMTFPFRHHFAGHWMQCLYPGYKAPSLFKNGCFFYNARPHMGAQVQGRTIAFPPDNPQMALLHFSFDSLSHYLEKLNTYTDTEAANMHRDGQPFFWQHAIRHFVRDMQGYYDRGAATRDGVHGFLYAFLSGFYRFEQHAKLFEIRLQQGQVQPAETAVPASVTEMLEYALAVANERPLPQAPAIRMERESASRAASVVWSGPLNDPSGYGEESRHFLFALEDAGVAVAAQPIPWSYDGVVLLPLERKRLEDLCQKPVSPGFLHITQNFPPAWVRHPEASVEIGRTMFETDRLPQDWVKACNRMDYIWVPSAFNKESFARAGVAADKLVVIPGCFDPAPFQAAHDPLPCLQEMKAGGRFVFLSVFDWTRHKGWDVLLKAFLQAFEGRDDVALALKVWSTQGYTAAMIREQAADYVKRELDHDLAQDSRIRFLEERLSREQMPALYQGADAFVLPSRGEGWGRPYMEAMASGLPTIGTNWSGNTAFMTPENSFLLDYDLRPVPEAGWREIPTYRGHRWAEPDAEQLKAQMRRIVEERGEAVQVGARAKEEICSRFNREVVGKILAAEIARLDELVRPHLVLVESGNTEETQAEPAREAKTKQQVAVRYEGDFFIWHSLAQVNRELCRALLPSGQLELSLVISSSHQFAPQEEPRFASLAPLPFATLSRPADVHIRHFFPPRLNKPEEGRFVLIQPWEYGYLPKRWIEPIQKNVDEVWCYSHYVAEVYRASGIEENKIQVVPLGVDTSVFAPTAPPYVFTTEPGASTLAESLPERFVFLFVGGTLHRKGIDILLDAYLKAFSAYDEVCLVVKDTGTNTVYRGQNQKERILGLVGDPFHAPIVYLEDDLSAHQMAGVFTAADCLVQPYRGEGFCLPALEALACGVPVIVPEGGPTDDFVDESVGWRVKAAKKPFGDGKIGEWECVGPTWMFEVAPEDLGRLMRQVYQNREEARRRGEQAVSRVQAGWTWEQSAKGARSRLQALKAQGPPAPTPNPLPRRVGEGKVRKHVGKEESASARVVSDRRSSARRPAAQRALPTLSLCMIVRNEERVLPACLESARPYVDEIIVVDTGSTDRTVEIANSYGAKVFHFPWCDDFSAARNVSLAHASCDWIIWMDADDTLPAECGKKLHETIFLVEQSVMGLMMQVRIPPAPGTDGFTVVDHLKIFRNRPDLRFEGRLHEQILESINRSGGKYERTDLYVVHSGYDYSPEGQKRKRERDLKILDLELKERPNHPFVHFCIGMTAYHLKDYGQAISALQKSLSLSGSEDSIARKSYAMLAGSYLEQRDIKQAVAWVEAGLALYPHDPELLFRAGAIYREAGDLAASERSYVKLLTAREVGHIDSIDVSMTGYKAHHNLALTYQDMGRMPEAEREWRAAVTDNPGFIPSWLGLGEFYLQIRRFDDVRTVITRVEELAPGQAQGLQRRLAAIQGLLP